MISICLHVVLNGMSSLIVSNQHGFKYIFVCIYMYICVCGGGVNFLLLLFILITLLVRDTKVLQPLYSLTGIRIS